jgi:hypothetical protein
MVVELLPLDNNVQRMLEGCKHYGLIAKYNNKTRPYVHVEANTEVEIANIYWLGVNLARPKIETGLCKSTF